MILHHLTLYRSRRSSGSYETDSIKSGCSDGFYQIQLDLVSLLFFTLLYLLYLAQIFKKTAGYSNFL
jgi:hypothetical protein